jgi:hypothetical protein
MRRRRRRRRRSRRRRRRREEEEEETEKEKEKEEREHEVCSKLRISSYTNHKKRNPKNVYHKPHFCEILY